jgi:hypothetical protein
MSSIPASTAVVVAPRFNVKPITRQCDKCAGFPEAPDPFSERLIMSRQWNFVCHGVTVFRQVPIHETA